MCRESILRGIMAVIIIVMPLQTLLANDDESEVHRWGVSADMGWLTQAEDAAGLVSGNTGNIFSVSADYFLNKRLALSGGIYAEQTGVLSDYVSSGIGPKSFWMAGLKAGAKFYFLPTSWIFQPHIGAMAYFNALNLKDTYSAFEFWDNRQASSRIHVDHNLQCPAVSLAPQIGFDLRIISSVSLTFAADYRWGLYGKSRVDARYIDGPNANTTFQVTPPINRMTFSVGVKVEFPMRSVNGDRVRNNLCGALYYWISSRR